MKLWNEICESISRSTKEEFRFQKALPLGGGCINDAHQLIGSTGRCFVKLNAPEAIDAFEAEAEALREMRSTETLRAPAPICSGRAEGRAWLALEFIELGHAGRDQKTFGAQLAQMHRKTAERFGWRRDNVIGATPQQNAWTEDWIEFYGTRRLGFQLRLAEEKGQRFRRADELLERLPEFFENYSPSPSLLHGDLWSGNFSFDPDGNPVVFDPATYYGDREAEFGIIFMFGGFSGEFFDGYDSAWPFDEGFKTRLPLYRLYHELNHFNLFGGGYASSVQSTIQELADQQ